MKAICWNDDIELIISDVDDTICEQFYDCSAAMIAKISELLNSGIYFILVSGQEKNNIFNRLIKYIPKNLRKQILLAHCNGSEMFAFNTYGDMGENPVYTLIKEKNFHIELGSFVDEIIRKFNLVKIEAKDNVRFNSKVNNDYQSVMYGNRKVQQSIDFLNGTDVNTFLLPDDYIFKYNGNDIRLYIKEYADYKSKKSNMNVCTLIGGTTGIDFCQKNVNKGEILKAIVEDSNNTSTFCQIISKQSEKNIEIWGDSFSKLNNGSDRYMSAAINRNIRSISFSDLDELDDEFNIVKWCGINMKAKGLLDYINTRKSSENVEKIVKIDFYKDSIEFDLRNKKISLNGCEFKDLNVVYNDKLIEAMNEKKVYLTDEKNEITNESKVLYYAGRSILSRELSTGTAYFDILLYNFQNHLIFKNSLNRSLGHENAKNEIEVHQILSGKAIMMLKSLEGVVYIKILSKGEYIEIPKGWFHCTYVLEENTCIANFYCDAPWENDVTQKPYFQISNDISLSWIEENINIKFKDGASGICSNNNINNLRKINIFDFNEIKENLFCIDINQESIFEIFRKFSI